MDIQEFLSTVITTSSTDGYLALATRSANHSANHSASNWKNEFYKYPAQLEQITEIALAYREAYDVYFTSYLFNQPHNIKANILTSRTLQVDLDNADPDKCKIPPSLLVETSQQRYQGYWFLDREIPIEEHEMLSRRLTYSIVNADHTGWPIGHFQRVSDTYNHKYDTPWLVKVLASNLKVYTPDDFDFLPAITFSPVESEKDSAFINYPPSASPSGDGPYELLESIRSKIPLSVYANYEVAQSDRSRALWSLLNAAFEAGLTRNQVYWLAKSSANNKFAGLKFNAERELAKDVVRAENIRKHKIHDPREILDAIRYMPKIPNLTKNRMMQEFVISDLKSGGQFMKVYGGMTYYMSKDSGRPVYIARAGEYLNALLDVRYGLNPTEKETSFIRAGIMDQYVDLPESAIECQLSYYNQEQNYLLLHAGKHDVLKITSSSIEKVPNGTDHILFSWETMIAPFTVPIKPTPRVDWGMEIFGDLKNITSISPEIARAELKAWLLFVLFRSAASSRPLLALLGQQGGQKGHPDYTNILTPIGWKQLKDICVGDAIIGSDGKSTIVTGVFDRGILPIKRVHFNDGTSVLTDEEHLWRVATHNNRVAYKDKAWIAAGRTIKTANLENWAYQHLAIPLVKPVEFNDNQLEVNPYLLGVLLGDGGLSDHGVRFTCAEGSRVKDEIEKLLPSGVSLNRLQSDRTTEEYTLAGDGRKNRNPLILSLRKLGLFGCHSYNKFVPDDYLYSSIENRIALLQGLLDTDGDICQYSKVGFSSSSEKLADAVTFLVQSLGGIARRTVGTSAYIDYTEGITIPGRLAYRVNINMPAGINPFRARADQYRPHTKYPPTRIFKRIEAAGEARVICLKVDAPDQLYVTENCIVTHNTTIMRRVYSFLYGKHVDVSGITKPEDFDHQAATVPVLCLDNVDTYQPWLPDKLAQSAGNTDIIVRKLYTDAGTIRRKRQAIVVLTAHNPKFYREDITDRMLPLIFERLTRFEPEGPIIQRVLSLRQALWESVIYDVQRILANPIPSHTDLQLRVEDFARLGEWCSEGIGERDLFRAAIKQVTQSQIAINIQEDQVLFQAIETFIKHPEHDHTLYRTPAIWFSLLSATSSDPATFVKQYRNQLGLGRKLWTLQASLKEYFIAEWRIEKNIRIWRLDARQIL